jgi:transcriptional regulator with XRE-family HTH domain
MKTMTGTELRRIRKRLGLTQRELAEELGWHRNSVAKAEQGAMKIGPTAARLARLLLAIHEGTIPRPRRGRK